VARWDHLVGAIVEPIAANENPGDLNLLAREGDVYVLGDNSAALAVDEVAQPEKGTPQRRALRLHPALIA
jgi:hypothetical protein